MPVKNRLISSVSSLPSRCAILRQAKPVAALVLLCFCLFALPNSPNLAQGGYPGGGEWTLSLEFTDNRWTSSSRNPTSGTFSIAPGSEAHDSMYATADPVTHTPGKTTIALTAVPVLRWYSSTGALPPSDKLRIKVYAYVESWASTVNTDTGGSVSASNGFDASVGTASQVKSDGSHLLQKDNTGRSTEVRFPAVTLSGSATGIVDSNGQGYGGYCWWAINVVQDPRSVAIASSLEPTNYKDPTTRLPTQNKRADSGFMKADTLAPEPGNTLSVEYFPIYNRGSWSSGSQFHWHSNNYSPDWDGVFNTFFFPNVPSPYVNYTNTPTTPGSNDYITLKLTDSNDGAEATNNYSVQFHAQYENWVHAPIIETHPLPLSQVFDDPHPEWTYLMTIDNGGSEPLSQKMTGSVTLSQTESGTIGGETSLGPPGVAAFKANESITVGHTHSYTYSTETTFTGAPHKRTRFYTAMSWEHHLNGVVDVYAANGFQGTPTWEGVWRSGTVSVGVREQDITP